MPAVAGTTVIDDFTPIDIKKFYARLKAGEHMNFAMNVSDTDAQKILNTSLAMVGEALEKYQAGYKDDGFEILANAVAYLANFVVKIFEASKANLNSEYTAITNQEPDNAVEEWLISKIKEVEDSLNIETSGTAYDYSQ